MDIYLNKDYKFESIFQMPWGENNGLLELSTYQIQLNLFTKLPLNHDLNQLPAVIKGESSDYRCIFAFNPIIIEKSEKLNRNYKLTKLKIIFSRILLCNNYDYDDKPNFNNASFSIDGTKEWFGKKDEDIISDYENGGILSIFNHKVSTEDFFIEGTYSINTKYNHLDNKYATTVPYFSLKFNSHKTIDEITHIIYQWRILHYLLTGINGEITKIVFHNAPELIESCYLYYPRSPNRKFDKVPSYAICRLHLDYFRNIDMETTINKWFSRTKEKTSSGNLFYYAISQSIFTPDKFLNMARALEGLTEDRCKYYIERGEEKRFKTSIKSFLSNYISKSKHINSLTNRIFDFKKTSFQDRLDSVLNDLSPCGKEFLNFISYSASDSPQIASLRNKYSHWHLGILEHDITRNEAEYYYKLKFILMYLYLSDLGIDENLIKHFILNNQNFAFRIKSLQKK